MSRRAPAGAAGLSRVGNAARMRDRGRAQGVVGATTGGLPLARGRPHAKSHDQEAVWTRARGANAVLDVDYLASEDADPKCQCHQAGLGKGSVADRSARDLQSGRRTDEADLKRVC